MDKYTVLCPHCEKTHERKRVDPPKSYTVRSCTSYGCIFFDTYPVDACRWTCEEVTPMKGGVPDHCPVNRKIVEVHTAEVDY